MYPKVCEYVHSFNQHISSLIGHRGCAVSIQSLSSISKEGHSLFIARRMTLLPIEFEASLHISETRRISNGDDSHPDHPSDIINRAFIHRAPAKMLALFADVILCAVSGDYYNAESVIFIETGAELLKQPVNAALGSSVYSGLQVSRWIELVTSRPGRPMDDANVILVEEVTGQAVVLASTGKSRKCKEEYHGEDADVSYGECALVYPEEEPEWLATTLFNLAADYYVREKEDQRKKWARKAVELADILGSSGGKEGDGRALLRAS